MPDPELGVTTDKDAYRIGETARIEITADWSDPRGGGSSDLWAIVTIEQQLDGGKWGNSQEHPEFPLHEHPRDDIDMGWLPIAIRGDRWGRFRAVAMVYEAERQELGTVDTEFTVEPKESTS